MNQKEWAEYWQKRAVKAEMCLTEIAAIADADGDEHGISAKVTAYYESVAAGEVKNTPLRPQLPPSSEGK